MLVVELLAAFVEGGVAWARAAARAARPKMMGPRVPGKSNSIPFSLPTDHAEGSARQMVEQVRAPSLVVVSLLLRAVGLLPDAAAAAASDARARAQHHLSLYKQIQGATAQLDNQEPKVRARPPPPPASAGVPKMQPFSDALSPSAALPARLPAARLSKVPKSEAPASTGLPLPRRRAAAPCLCPPGFRRLLTLARVCVCRAVLSAPAAMEGRQPEEARR